MTTTEPTIRELLAEIQALRAELDGLRAELRTEIRTERLTVVHPADGRRLVWTELLSNSVALNVQWGEGDDKPYAALGAGDEVDGESWVVATNGYKICAVMGAGVGQPGTLELDPAGAEREGPFMRLDAEQGVTMRRMYTDIVGVVRFEDAA